MTLCWLLRSEPEHVDSLLDAVSRYAVLQLSAPERPDVVPRLLSEVRSADVRCWWAILMVDQFASLTTSCDLL